MANTIGITKLPYDAHLGYARRVSGSEEPATGAVSKTKAETVPQAVAQPLVIDDRLAHFLHAGRPQTRAMYPGPPPSSHVSDVWDAAGILMRVRPVKLWNGLETRHPTILMFLKELRKVLKERQAIWDGRHGMFGE